MHAPHACRYDPNPRVAESMSHILVTIVPQRAAALTENFAAVMRELLDSLAGRPWRARQAACLGAADILPGRRWGLLQGTFGELWEVALRVADDIKDSVRVNGERLLRAVGNVTKRYVITFIQCLDILDGVGCYRSLICAIWCNYSVPGAAVFLNTMWCKYSSV